MRSLSIEEQIDALKKYFEHLYSGSDDLYHITWDDIASTPDTTFVLTQPKCVCGSHAPKGRQHSTWCDIFDEDATDLNIVLEDPPGVGQP